ncbi:hypothetical protein TYRP_017529 [Tyrophagus putrescentiae]|nr:hypothetical protein TYRP_017529 [Tyrophagus putrescentiae]
MKHKGQIFPEQLVVNKFVKAFLQFSSVVAPKTKDLSGSPACTQICQSARTPMVLVKLRLLLLWAF